MTGTPITSRNDVRTNQDRLQQLPSTKRELLWLLFACCATIALGARAAPTWTPAHTVIVVLENRSARQIEGNKDAPYLNTLAQGGAYMARAYFAQTPYGILPSGHSYYLPARPSQPNYLYLFSANNQGVRVGIGNGLIPASMRPFTTPNLGAAVINAGGTFSSFSESLPYPHYDDPVDPGGTEAKPDLYRRKHNPVINWVNLTARRLPGDKSRFVLAVSVNLGFANTHDPVDGKDYRGFAVNARGNPIGYDQLPTVSIVIPNEQHDAHSDSIAAADAWLGAHIKPYADWARTHNSLLVVTWDEDGSTDASHGDPDKTGQDTIFTVFYGPTNAVIPGRYAERIDHLNVLATILDRHRVLTQFRSDFLEAFGRSAEGRAEFANLVPIKDLFGEGPPLRAR